MNTTDILKKLSGATSKKGLAIGGAGALGMAVPFTRNLILNELLGVDDFKRALKYADEGEFSKMLKSLGAGAFELGSTVIPGGNILKGAKVGSTVLKSSPIGGRVVSRIPGLVDAGMLTSRGTNALNAFRAAETAQLLDAANAGSQMLLGRGLNIGSASNMAREAERARNLEVLRRIAAAQGGQSYAF
jgi:hypothetical protein